MMGCLLAGIWMLFGNGVKIGERQIQDDNRVEFGIWTPNTVFEQTFVAVDHDLSRIDFRLDAYNFWDSPYLECRVFELDVEQAPYDLTYDDLRQNRREVRAVKLHGWLLSPYMLNVCAFDPIPDSQGKRYMVSLQSPEVKHGGSSILKASFRKRLETEVFFVNGEKQEEHDLAFRVLYTRPRRTLFKDSIDSLVLQKPFPFSQPAVLYFLVGLYAALLFLLIWRLGSSGVCQNN